MKFLVRQLSRALLPKSIRLSLHYFRRHKDYIILPKGELGYAEDGLYTFNAAPFLADERFQHAYKLGASTGSWHGLAIRWRAYVACWASAHAAQLAGDFVECGVNRGGLARAIVDYTGFGQLEKRFFLVDTFTGLVPEYLSEVEKQKGFLEHFAYYNDNTQELVTTTFANFTNVKIVQGAVPDVLLDIPVAQIAYLSLDMNCTMPEIKAAEFFWDRIVPGGIVLLDDYTQKLHSEQRAAFDNFALRRGTRVLSLPTGQGLILKVEQPV